MTDDLARWRHILRCLETRLPWQQYSYFVLLSGNDIALLEHAILEIVNKLEVERVRNDQTNPQDL